MVSVTVERLDTPRGELVLRRDGDHHEIVSNGTFLMDTRDGRSERELVRAAVRGPGARVLVGGLGVGFSLAEALTLDPAAVTVVEIEPAVLRWNREHLGRSGVLDDPRVTVVVDDLAAFLARDRQDYDAVCLDVDNGPEWTVTVDNAALYGDPGLSAVDRRLAPGRHAGDLERAPVRRLRGRPARPVRHRRDARDPGTARRARRGLGGPRPAPLTLLVGEPGGTVRPLGLCLVLRGVTQRRGRSRAGQVLPLGLCLCSAG